MFKSAGLSKPWIDSEEIEIPESPDLGLIFQELPRLTNAVDDAYFDRIYPDWAQRMSRLHWTPVPVALRAAQLLTENHSSGARVLDLGSGAGKFCLVGASTYGGDFFGIEQRSHLVNLSKK